MHPRLPLLLLLCQVDQSGLFLPSRDYYLNKTANNKVKIKGGKTLAVTAGKQIDLLID